MGFLGLWSMFDYRVEAGERIALNCTWRARP